MPVSYHTFYMFLLIYYFVPTLLLNCSFKYVPCNGSLCSAVFRDVNISIHRLLTVVAIAKVKRI